jgi:hypothetical protein
VTKERGGATHRRRQRLPRNAAQSRYDITSGGQTNKSLVHLTDSGCEDEVACEQTANCWCPAHDLNTPLELRTGPNMSPSIRRCQTARFGGAKIDILCIKVPLKRHGFFLCGHIKMRRSQSARLWEARAERHELQNLDAQLRSTITPPSLENRHTGHIYRRNETDSVRFLRTLEIDFRRRAVIPPRQGHHQSRRRLQQQDLENVLYELTMG